MLNPIRRFREAPCKRLVGGGLGEGGVGKADALVGGIEDGVEALEEGVAVDEVETLAGVGAKVVDDAVDASGNTTDVGVERAGENLTVGSELEGASAVDEEQALEGAELGVVETEEAGVSIVDTASRRLVLGEGVGGDEDEGCA